MKQLKWWFFVAIAFLGMASCSVEKRVHRKGYHVEWFGQKHTVKTQEQTEEMAQETDIEPLQTVASAEESTAAVEMPSTAQDQPVAPIVHDAPLKKMVEKKATRKSRGDVKMPAQDVWSGQRAAVQDVTGADNAATETDLIVCVIIAFLLPPLGVYLFYDKINRDFWITLILTICVPYFGGLIYALYVMLFK